VLSRAAVLWDGKSDLAAQVRTTHISSAVFDATGAETSRTLPGGFSLTTGYDVLGRTQKVVAALGEDVRTLVGSATYDERGLLTGADYGNGLRAHGTWSYDYDEVQNLISKSTQVGSAAASVVSMSYGEAAGPNALTHLGAQKLDYDALGMLKAKDSAVFKPTDGEVKIRQGTELKEPP
jgi:YD repeat-containing protein